MASLSINIDNTLNAIKSNIIPGKFIENGFMFPVIVNKNKGGKKILWQLEIKLMKNNKYVPIKEEYLDRPLFKLSSDYKAEIITHSKQEDGKERDNTPIIISSGKNIGKVNETNVITQAFRDALSMYNKHNKKDNERPPPMLIQSINNSKKAILTDEDFKNGITLQKKFNGVRYITYRKNNNIIQYSRTGTEYYPADNINEELEILFNNLPKFIIGKYGIDSNKEIEIYKNSDVYLDGEFYAHGQTLNYISGQARKEKKESNINYFIFDLFFPNAIKNGYNMISKHRQEYLSDLFDNLKLKYIKKVKNYKVHNMTEINELTNSFLKEGYEGSIARKDIESYEYSYNNYHSTNLLKIKPVHSDEFYVVGYTEGVKGKDKGKIIWICEVNNSKNKEDRLFNVVPNLSLINREKLYNCMSKKINNSSDITIFDKYVKGLPLTIEYSELSTKTGKPLQAKAIAFRTYEDKNDPIKKLYEICDITI